MKGKHLVELLITKLSSSNTQKLDQNQSVLSNSYPPPLVPIDRPMHLRTNLVRPTTYHLLHRRSPTSIKNPHSQPPSRRSMSTSTLLSLIPEDAWDSHMHVFSPEALSPDQQRRSAYVPPEATVPQALGVLGRLGQGRGQGQRQGRDAGTGSEAEAEAGKGKSLRMCIVQPSIYGVDNDLTLSGVGELNVQRARPGSSSSSGVGSGSGTGSGENTIDGVSGGCAVVEIDPDDCPKEVLEGMHKRGSRGVRLVFFSVFLFGESYIDL